MDEARNHHAPMEKERKKADDENKCKKQRKKKSSNSLFCCLVQRWQEDNNNRLPTTSNPHQKRRKGHCLCFCGRRKWVFLIFLCVIISVVLAVVLWPRIPLIRVEGAQLSSSAKVTQTQQYVNNAIIGNVAFESTWLLNITMDNRSNLLNTRFDKIQIVAKDAMTGLPIGKSLNDNIIWVAGHTISTIQLPMTINYQARDRSDATFSNLLRACIDIVRW